MPLGLHVGFLLLPALAVANSVSTVAGILALCKVSAPKSMNGDPTGRSPCNCAQLSLSL